MNINKFSMDKAYPAHNGTIWAHDFIPDGMPAPFESTWGYLPGKGIIETHAHPTQEMYVVFKGHGLCRVGDEEAWVECGDVIEIPPMKEHSIENQSDEPLLWTAIWWPAIEK